MGGFQISMQLTNRDAGISPANAADPDSSAGALQAALLLAEVAHRAAEADVLPARAARRVRVLHRAAVHVHAVVVATGQGSAAVVAIGSGRERVGDAGRRGAGAGLGAMDVPEAMQRLLLLLLAVRVRVRGQLLFDDDGVLRLLLALRRPLLCRVQQVQGVLCGQA